MDDPKVVFILATNYSGSHLLAQLLSAHSRCAGVGELHNYRKFRGRGSRSGNLVDDYGHHPAFAGLDALPVSRWHARILARLRQEQPALSHLIDNSKRPAWAARFPGERSYAVHLLRDPRALVARWLRTYDTAEALRRQRRRVWRRRPWALGRTRDAVGTYLEKWLIANLAISRRPPGRGAPVVAYRDLTLATEAVLRRLMPALDLQFEPDQLRYGSAGGALGTRKREYLAEAEHSAIHIDLRWQDQLSTAELVQVERHDAIRRYLTSVGLRMTHDGLTAEGMDGGGMEGG